MIVIKPNCLITPNNYLSIISIAYEYLNPYNFVLIIFFFDSYNW